MSPTPESDVADKSELPGSGMSVARLRTILQSEPECVKTVNTDGQLIDLNPAGLRMIGATDVEQIRGTHLSMMVDPRDWPTYQKNMACVFQGETISWQFRCNSPQGDQRWMEQTAGPVYSESDPGKVTEMVAITRDITDKKRDENRLLTAKENAERANAAKTNFLANMSHEIRTPMNGILGMVNMLTETSLTDEQRGWVDVIQQSSESLLRILNDILDLSKVEAGHIDLEKSRFRISEQIAELQRLHSANASRKGIALELTGCEQMEIERYGDPVRILQILNNLIDNAIKFTSSGRVTGRFTCKKSWENPPQACQHEDVDHVHITITDTGIGMTVEQTEKVFAPFSQADASTTRRYGGTGLGLTIAKTLTELMGGNIKVESEVGLGTTFEIMLKLPTTQQANLPDITTDQSSSRTGKTAPESAPLRVMAVEDGDVNRLVLSHILKKLNVTVSMAFDGKQAIELFKEERFDLILMDIHMPVMDGIASSEEIRKIEAQLGIDETPIVAVTASVTDSEVDRYKQFGFSHCIAKPMEPWRLREVIDEIRG